MSGFDEAGRLGIVRERFADLTNGHFEHGVADKRVRPDRRDQILLRDELTRFGNKVLEHREGLGPELDGLRTLPKTLVHEVECERGEMDVAWMRHELPDVTEALPRRYDWDSKRPLLSFW